MGGFEFGDERGPAAETYDQCRVAAFITQMRFSDYPNLAFRNTLRLHFGPAHLREFSQRLFQGGDEGFRESGFDGSLLHYAQFRQPHAVGR